MEFARLAGEGEDWWGSVRLKFEFFFCRVLSEFRNLG